MIAPRLSAPGDRERAAAYVAPVVAAVPRLLGCLDRESQSISYGSFDRTHWGWKFCDFPIIMSQIAAYPLALLWRHPLEGNPYHQNGQVLQWLEGSLAYVCRQQHRNGSFDSVAPYIQDHGASLYMAYLLAECRRHLAGAIDRRLDDEMLRSIEAACEFALHSDEDYAFISNHRALFALTFLDAAEMCGVSKFQQRAETTIDEILARQSPEGWYLEYGGPDPGYESLSIFYLSMYWRRSGESRVLDSLRRSVEFYSHFVHPDGSVGGCYGSRHTSLYAPAGFELLSLAVPTAAAVARFMRRQLPHGNVVTPATADPQNLAVCAYTYLEGCLEPRIDGIVPDLPCERLREVRHFRASGLVVAGTDTYYAVANTSKGGVCRVFDRGRRQPAYEDAGYIAAIGNRRYTSQLIGFSTADLATPRREAVTTAQFGEVRQELPTAAKWIVLRLLNLTVFRSRVLGAWIRGRIVRRLILDRRRGPLQLRRSIVFDDDRIRFCDRLTLSPRATVKSLNRCRNFTPIHMGSAKYFHASELHATPLLDTADGVARLNAERAISYVHEVRVAVAERDSAVFYEAATPS